MSPIYITVQRSLLWLTSGLLWLSSSTPLLALPLVPAPPLNGSSAILIDYHSGQVLAEQQADRQHYPASLIKIMISYVVGQALKSGTIQLTDQVTVSANAADRLKFADSSKMFLKAGQRVSVAELQKGIIVQSGNDACVAMAEHVAGSEAGLVALMNHYAQQLQLTNTHFTNVHGLDHPEQTTSARDMAQLARALIRDLPDEYHHYQQKSFTFNGITQNNRNTLLWDSSLQVDGVKTGCTSQAGFNLVATATEGERRLIAVILGAPTAAMRSVECKKWLQWGLRFFERQQLASAGETLTQAKVWFGQQSEAHLGISTPLYLMLPRGTDGKIVQHYHLNEHLTAPLQTHQVVGQIRFELDGKLLAERPLQVLKPVARGSWFIYCRDWLILWWQQKR
ncbi:MAG: D-alanyl-D-alanine carboxypeptidase family protein [Candidatus Symbiodolus clandestinus]